MPLYPKPLPTFDYRGFHRYFLTFCTFERNRYFAEADNVWLVCDRFLRGAGETDFAIIAYCFMPDHVHLLIEGTRDDADMKDFVKRAKQYSGFYSRRRTRNSLWQRYGFERVLRQEEDTPSVVKYIIENPIRAGLVKNAQDYPFWGSNVYSREELLEYVARAA